MNSQAHAEALEAGDIIDRLHEEGRESDRDLRNTRTQLRLARRDRSELLSALVDWRDWADDHPALPNANLDGHLAMKIDCAISAVIGGGR